MFPRAALPGIVSEVARGRHRQYASRQAGTPSAGIWAALIAIECGHTAIWRNLDQGVRGRVPHPDLRRKLLFTVAIMAIYRIGTFVPAPFVSLANVRECTEKAGDDGFLGMLNMFSGGAMLQLSVFALGIMPYITASIIIQLLGVVIPRFEQLRKEGQSGTAKLTEYTRYVTIGLALLQSSVFISLPTPRCSGTASPRSSPRPRP